MELEDTGHALWSELVLSWVLSLRFGLGLPAATPEYEPEGGYPLSDVERHYGSDYSL